MAHTPTSVKRTVKPPPPPTCGPSGRWKSNAWRAAAQEVLAAEGSDASVRCYGTNGWQSRWLWQKRRTTPHEDRSLPQSSGRWRSTRRTPAYGHRRLLHRGRGRHPCGAWAAEGYRSLRHSSGSGPLLVVATLAAAEADGVDAASLSFLTARALEDTRKEEEVRKKEDEERLAAKERKEARSRRRCVRPGTSTTPGFKLRTAPTGITSRPWSTAHTLRPRLLGP